MNPTSLFLTGQKIQSLKWNLHCMSVLANAGQQKEKLKYARLTRLYKNTLDNLNSQLVNRAISEEEAINKLIIQSNLICVSASNLLNEIVHKERAIRQGMKQWKIENQELRLYEAGQYFTFLKTILDILVSIQQVKVLNIDYIRKLMIKLGNFEEEVRGELCLSLVNKYSLLDAHLLAIKSILYYAERCK